MIYGKNSRNIKRRHKKVYDNLNVNYDLWLGESDAAEYFDELKIFMKKRNY